MARASRLRKEIDQLISSPGPGISAWPVGYSSTFQVESFLSDIGPLAFEGQIIGPDDSPFSGGIFKISISIPEKYPIEVPRARFLTPIRHPNIDSDGRICLDLLKPPPHGTWSPSISLNTLLLSIRLLLGNPNADDGLVPDITDEYRQNRALWFSKARELTLKYAIDDLKDENNKDIDAVSPPVVLSVTDPSNAVEEVPNVMNVIESHTSSSVTILSDDDDDDDEDDEEENKLDANELESSKNEISLSKRKEREDGDMNVSSDIKRLRP